MSFANELDIPTRLAAEAGVAIQKVRDEARANPTQKADDAGPVTAADLAADRLVREGLAEAFPDDDVITEETWEKGEKAAPRSRVWIVDPLDGTKDFVAGRPDYAVMIGLLVDGAPKVGVVHQPATRVTWRGVDEDGARICERIDADGAVQPCAMADVLPGSGGRFALSRSHRSPLEDWLSDELGATIVPQGSVGLKIALLVDGRADAYISGSTRIKIWDTCGPTALLRAAGGRMTALDLSPLSWTGAAAHDKGLRAITPAAADAYDDKLDEAVRMWRERHGGRTD